MTPVVAGNVESPALHEHPEGEENLGEVVHQQDLLQLKRLPVLHQPANKNSVDSSEQETRLFTKFPVKIIFGGKEIFSLLLLLHKHKMRVMT